MPSSGMLHHVAVVRIEIPPKRWFLQEPHGVPSQKTGFVIVTAMKTSSLTYQYRLQIGLSHLDSRTQKIYLCRFVMTSYLIHHTQT
jgi:hypothetical protein